MVQKLPESKLCPWTLRLVAALCSVTLSNLLSLRCSFVLHSPLWQRLPQFDDRVCGKQYLFCLFKLISSYCHWVSLSSPILRLSFFNFSMLLRTLDLCYVSHSLIAFPNWKILDYVFSPVWVVPYFSSARAIRKRMWKSGFITTGEYQTRGECVPAFLFQNAVNPSGKMLPSACLLSLSYSYPINSCGICLFPVCWTLFPSTEPEWVLKYVIYYVGSGFTVLLL